MSDEIEKYDDENLTETAEAADSKKSEKSQAKPKKKIKNLAAKAFESFEFLSEEKAEVSEAAAQEALSELSENLEATAKAEEAASVIEESFEEGVSFVETENSENEQEFAGDEEEAESSEATMAGETLEEVELEGAEVLEASDDEEAEPKDRYAHLSLDEREALEEVEAREAQEAADEENEQSEELPEYTAADVEGSELEGFESAEIEEKLFIDDEQAESIIESLLFASDKPVSMTTLRELFKDTNIEKAHIKRILERLAVEYAGGRRGVVLEEVTGGFQLRTKVDNMNFLRRLLKGRSFKLSGPALEVLSIVAYKQPVIKSEIDEIRGVESGHLLRALMEKGLVNFEGKSELPGRPMQYATTKKFLEIFGLRNLKELPTLSQIDELLPEGIGGEEEKKEKLSDITDSMSQAIAGTYSEGEEELEKIQSELQTVDTTTAFFEEEKKRIKDEENRQRAQDIREAVAVGESVDKKDLKWLAKYEAELAAAAALTLKAHEAEELAKADEPAIEVAEGIAASDSAEFTNDESEADESSEEMMDASAHEESSDQNMESSSSDESSEEMAQETSDEDSGIGAQLQEIGYVEDSQDSSESDQDDSISSDPDAEDHT